MYYVPFVNRIAFLLHSSRQMRQKWVKGDTIDEEVIGTVSHHLVYFFVSANDAIFKLRWYWSARKYYWLQSLYWYQCLYDGSYRFSYCYGVHARDSSVTLPPWPPRIMKSQRFYVPLVNCLHWHLPIYYYNTNHHVRLHRALQFSSDRFCK